MVPVIMKVRTAVWAAAVMVVAGAACVMAIDPGAAPAPPGSARPADLPSAGGTDVLNTLELTIVSMEVERKVLTGSLSPTHPRVRDLDKRLEAYRAAHQAASERHQQRAAAADAWDSQRQRIMEELQETLRHVQQTVQRQQEAIDRLTKAIEDLQSPLADPAARPPAPGNPGGDA